MNGDTIFAGPVPELYDQTLGPIQFQPFAALLAARLRPEDRAILEIAAGTGIVTRALRAALPASEIVATDLNEAMLAVARRKPGLEGVSWQQADAQALPMPDRSFDAVVCGFGYMFMPDKVRAFGEARRVLRPSGRIVCTIWDRIQGNPLQDLVEEALAELLPQDPPRFFSRIPFGYHDRQRIGADLRAAGFRTVLVEPVTCESGETTALQVAIGCCQGTPLRAEIEARDPAGVARATEAAEARLRARLGSGRFRLPIDALLVTAA